MTVSKSQARAKRYFAEFAKKKQVPTPVDKEEFRRLLEKFYYEFCPRHGYYGHIGGGDEAMAKKSIKECGYFLYQWQDDYIKAFFESVFYQKPMDIIVSVLRQVGKTDVAALCAAFVFQEYYNTFGKAVSIAVFAPTKGTADILFRRICSFIDRGVLSEDGDTKERKISMKGDMLNLFGIYDETKGSTIEGNVFDIILRDEAHMGNDHKFIDETEPTRFSRGGTLVMIGNGGKSDCLFYQDIVRGDSYDEATQFTTKLIRYTWIDVEPYLSMLSDMGISTAKTRLNAIRHYIKKHGAKSIAVLKNIYCKWSLEFDSVLTREQLVACLSNDIYFPESGKPLYMGLDFATLHDRTIATIMDEDRNIIDWIIVKDKNMVARAREQIEFLKDECKRLGYLEHIVALGFDATGLGSFGVIELLEEYFMCDLLEYKFSASKKHDWYEAAIESISTDYIENRVRIPAIHQCTEHFIREWSELKRHALPIQKYDSFNAPQGEDKFDDFCFVAGTKVKTLFGDKNIENIKEGDFVWTPFGLRAVLHSKQTGVLPVIDNIGLSGTSKHPVYMKNEGFIPLAIAEEAGIIKPSLINILKWNSQKLSYLTESTTDSWEQEDIIFHSMQITKKEKEQKDFMSQYGNITTKRKFRKAFAYIMSMTIVSTTIFLTWNLSIVANMLARILKKEWKTPNFIKKLSKISTVQKTEEKVLKLVEPQNTEKNEVKFQKGHGKTQYRIPFVSVLLVGIRSLLIGKGQNTVAIDVNKKMHEKEETRRKPVYNLTVDGGTYFANNILVHNCASYAICLNVRGLDISLYNIENKYDKALDEYDKKQKKIPSHFTGYSSYFPASTPSSSESIVTS